jgi:2-methylisocitrate lyase-like PEP mutase family enzyme
MDANGFAELHRHGCFLLPNAWDAGSARMLAAAGFPAIATTSAGVAFSLGLPDHGYGGRVERDPMLQRVKEIVDAAAVPVSADLEDGYGESPEAVAETITMTIAVGAAGGGIEDFTGDSSQPLYQRERAIDRIRAAREAVDRSPKTFVLVGRTDGLLVGAPLDECIDRSNAYLEAGADCAFVPGAADPDTISRLVAELNGPLNVVMGLSGNRLTLKELADLGVRRVTVGGSIVRALYEHLRRAARELHDQGTFTYADQQIPQSELNAIFSSR